MLFTAEEVAQRLAGRMKELRLARDWKRETLAERAGISAGTVKRFETTGQIALDNLLKLALALGCLDQFEAVFAPPPARSLAELERRSQAPARQRGRR
ncbi:DNA-binding transcriptional regulator, XRE family [Nannocystis exedens]|uniref:DNA-binding transcriptional regulator, XRE family n=1 Tax=Nannocystis exedens TaxID=54 RepID=A0A1I2FZD8_9BACT|nr:helix-turn-helix transcriptional regulator [Nannocystis exedens]PCC74550.1 helix-turn-helix protein [Nannocystis exedens]SFF10178.1 DNA-binding transcriptional regulator, XRE family [Nannocystis exedens]